MVHQIGCSLPTMIYHALTAANFTKLPMVWGNPFSWGGPLLLVAFLCHQDRRGRFRRLSCLCEWPWRWNHGFLAPETFISGELWTAFLTSGSTWHMHGTPSKQCKMLNIILMWYPYLDVQLGMVPCDRTMVSIPRRCTAHQQRHRFTARRARLRCCWVPGMKLPSVCRRMPRQPSRPWALASSTSSPSGRPMLWLEWHAVFLGWLGGRAHVYNKHVENVYYIYDMCVCFILFMYHI